MTECKRFEANRQITFSCMETILKALLFWMATVITASSKITTLTNYFVNSKSAQKKSAALNSFQRLVLNPNG